MKDLGTAKKTELIGVYEKAKGDKPFITYIRFLDSSIPVLSKTKRIAAIKYNILARFFQGDNAKQNDIKVSQAEYRKIAKELFYQLTTPTNVQLSYSIQGRKKITNASTPFVGVYKCKGRESYQAYIAKDNKTYSLGYYKTDILGAVAYNIAALVLYGETAELNNVDMCLATNEFILKILQKLNVSESLVDYVAECIDRRKKEFKNDI